MRVERWKQALWAVGAISALTSATPGAVQSQILFEPPNPVARELRSRAPGGPALRSTADASMRARLPELSPTCPFGVPSAWSYTKCGALNFQDGEDMLVTTTSDVTARYSLATLDPWPPIFGCISTLATPLGSACASGAKAQTNFGESKVYAEVRGGYEETVPYDDADPSQGEYDYYVDTDASASSEWVSEFTPDFTGWLNLQFSVERHGAGRPKDAGNANLQIGVFARPDNLLAPPLRPGNLEFDPQWTFYGNSFEEFGSNPNFWGWTSPYAERFDDFGFGVSFLTGGFYVEAGRSYSLVSRLSANASGNEFIDFWGTARFDAFEVPDGVDPATAFSSNSAGFAVRTAGSGPGPVVPEPASLALVTTGLAGLLVAHRRRRRYPATSR